MALRPLFWRLRRSFRIPAFSTQLIQFHIRAQLPRSMKFPSILSVRILLFAFASHPTACRYPMRLFRALKEQPIHGDAFFLSIDYHNYLFAATRNIIQNIQI